MLVRPVWLGLIMLLATSGVGQSQNIPRTDTVDAFLGTEMKERHFPGIQVEVVQHGKLVLTRASGLADVQRSVPVITKIPISIASMTRAFEADVNAGGYYYDPMAVDEMTKLVERVLADHKDVLRNPEAANAIGEMLDTFVTAGWPTAMTLTFRLDEAIR
jgi:hypothetical protein